MTNRTGI